MPETITIDTGTLFTLLGLTSGFLLLIFLLIPRFIDWGITTFFSEQIKEAYQIIIPPYYS